MNVVIATKDSQTAVYRCDEGFKFGEGSQDEAEVAKALTDALTAKGYYCETVEAQTPGSELA